MSFTYFAVILVGNDKHLDANPFDSVVKPPVQLITSARVDVGVVAERWYP